jgi:putative ABC transport system permease protein
MFDQLRVHLRALLLRESVEAELDEELHSHLEREIERNRANGMSVEDAVASARRTFGNIGAVKEDAREAWTWRTLDELTRDLRFAIRTLRRRPTFTVIAVTTIALGIGAATSIYSVVDAVLVRPLPFRDPNHIVAIWQTNAAWKKNEILAAQWDHGTISIPQYRDLQAQQTAFDDVAIWMPQNATLVEGEHPEIVRAISISPSLLNVLGVYPALGRAFTADESTPTGARVTMLSYEAWVSRYGANNEVLNRVVRFEDTSRIIIGVLPPRFTLDRTTTPGADNGGQVGSAEFWMPIGQDSTNYFQRGSMNAHALGRLKQDVSVARATQLTEQILHPPGVRNPAGYDGTRVVSWQVDETREVREPLLLLLASVSILLLIASLNTATLLLGEGAAREQEMSVRMALGAGRARLTRQLLIESIALATGGAVLGVAMAWSGTRTLVGLAPPGIPGLAGVHVDLRALAFATVITVATGIGVGLAPALTLAGNKSGLLAGGAASRTTRGRGQLQRMMIATELALSVILLVGAALLVRTLDRITQVNPGFRADHLLAVRATLPRSMFFDTTASRIFYEAALVRLAALPGVTAVTAASQLPFMGGPSKSPFNLESEMDRTTDGTVSAEARLHWHWVQQRVVMPGYFPTLGIPLLAGRDFSNDDRVGSENVAVISEAVVRRDFAGHAPLGTRIYFLGAWRTIVGVVGDVHLARLSSDLEATLYTPSTQRGLFGMPFVVRTTSDPAALTATVRNTVAAIEPSAVVSTADVMTDAVKRSFVTERYRAVLFALFGALAAVLAMVGIYGATARAVERRLREAAIRIALGASQQSIHLILIRGTFSGAVIGIAAGLAISLAATRLLIPYLYGVSAKDPVTYAAIPALLIIVCVLASWLPARRAASVRITALLGSE